MTEMIAAEPSIARRILDRLADPHGPAGQLAGAVGQAASAGEPIVVTGCGTSEHAALGDRRDPDARRSGRPGCTGASAR